MKKLKQLKGAKALNKKEQQSINGGGNKCLTLSECELICNFGMWCDTYAGTNCYGCVPSGSA